MHFHPLHIIYKVFSRYLEGEEKKEFLKLSIRFKKPNTKHFYNAMMAQFDIEQLRFSPLILEDIWIYNYIKYEVNIKIKRSGLIAKYEREAFIYDDNEFWEYVRDRKLSLNKLEVLDHFKTRFGSMINPEIVSVKYCQSKSNAYVEMLFSNNNSVPVVMDLDFMADGSEVDDNTCFDAIPNLFKPEADFFENVNCLIELDPYSLIICLDNLFTENATQEIARNFPP